MKTGFQALDYYLGDLKKPINLKEDPELWNYKAFIKLLFYEKNLPKYACENNVYYWWYKGSYHSAEFLEGIEDKIIGWENDPIYKDGWGIDKKDITQINLLSEQEVQKLPPEIREYGYVWWLRTPYKEYICGVNELGDIGSYQVDWQDGCARPALIIPSLSSLNLQVGDEICLGYKKWIIISEDKVLYNDQPKKCIFDNDTNDYEKSEIKQYINHMI